MKVLSSDIGYLYCDHCKLKYHISAFNLENRMLAPSFCDSCHNILVLFLNDLGIRIERVVAMRMKNLKAIG